MNFLSRFCSLLLICTACIHTFAEGSQEARLKREVNVKTQIFITLKQQIEMVQINSFENSNFVNIIDSSGIPIKRKSPDRVKAVALAYLFSLFTLYIILIGKENFNLIKKYILGII